MERAMMANRIQFPEMRLEVVAALESLSDPLRQERWGVVEEGVNYFDDLTLNVHTLYDDCMVLPEPQVAVPAILNEAETPAFRDLEAALGPMIRDLGEEPDDVYTSDPRWPGVMEAAARALEVMRRCEEGAQK